MMALRDIYNYIIQKVIGTAPNSLRARVIKGATGSFVLRAISVLLGLISSILLARFIGAHGYGIYTYTLAWVNLLMIVSTVGTHKLLTREVAVNLQQQQWSKLHGLLRWTNLLATSASTLLGLILAGITFWLYTTSGSEKTFALIIGSFLLPFLTLSTLREATLQGLHHVITGQIPESVIRPLMLIILILISYLLLGDSFTGTIAIANNLAASIVAFMAGSYLLFRRIPSSVRSTKPQYLTSEWLNSILPFFFLGGLQAANSQIAVLILGMFSDPSDVGVFSVSLRIASLLSFFLMSVNVIMAPNIASLYSTGDHARLQSLTTKSARAILVLSLPVVLIIIVFGKYLLNFFGQEFNTGYNILVILTIGQFFNGIMGSVGLLLTMTRHEKDALWVVTIGFVINATLCTILIPLFSALGAAISMTTYTFIWNIIFGILVFKRTKIMPSIIGRKI